MLKSHIQPQEKKKSFAFDQSKDEIASSEDKKKAHEYLDRRTWQALFSSDEGQQNFRSAIYQMLGAVLMDGELFTLDGVINPREGQHHIAKLPKKYYGPFYDFVDYLLEKSENNTTSMCILLLEWYKPIPRLKRLYGNEAATDYINKSRLVIEIREKLGIKPIIKQIEEENEEQEESKEDKKATIEEEPAEYEKELTPAKAKLGKDKSYTAKDFYIDGLMKQIESDDKMAKSLFKKAAKLGYKEEIESKKNPQEGPSKTGIDYEFIAANLDKNELEEQLRAQQESGHISNAEEKPFKALNQCLLGISYYHKKDYEKAFKYFLEAAKNGNVEGQYNTGLCFFNGKGTQKNFTEALKYFKIAAENGNINAYHYIGICLQNGYGTEQDEEQALIYLKKAAERGNVKSQFLLGRYLLKADNETHKDNEEAFKYLNMAAINGNCDAQYFAGYFLYEGIGTAQDFNRAFQYLKISASAGNIPSLYQLGLCFLHGHGTKEDTQQAFKYFLEAANNGIVQAQYDTGACLFNGSGVDKDLNRASKYFEMAANQGHEKAKQILESGIINKMILQQQAESLQKTIKLLIKITQRNYTEAGDLNLAMGLYAKIFSSDEKGKKAKKLFDELPENKRKEQITMVVNQHFLLQFEQQSVSFPGPSPKQSEASPIKSKDPISKEVYFYSS